MSMVLSGSSMVGPGWDYITSPYNKKHVRKPGKRDVGGPTLESKLEERVINRGWRKSAARMAHDLMVKPDEVWAALLRTDRLDLQWHWKEPSQPHGSGKWNHVIVPVEEIK